MTVQSIRAILNADKMRISFRRLAFCLLALVAVTSRAFAQNGAESAFQPDRGTTTPGSYSITDIENISLTNGNLNLTIPLASLPPIAGGKLSWTVNAVYNSKMWDLRSDQYPADFHHLDPYSIRIVDRSPNAGWTIGATYRLELRTSDEEVATLGCSGALECAYAAFRYKYFFVTPDGARHELRPLDAPRFNGPYVWRIGYYSQTPATSLTPMRYYSFDGSYLYAVINPPGSAIQWTVYMKDGTRVTRDSSGVQRIYDTNGNNIKIYGTVDGGGVNVTHYVDELTGREIKVSRAPGSSVTQVQYQTTGGTWMTIDVNWGTTTVFGLAYNVGDRACVDFSFLHQATFPVVRSIILPQTEPGLPGRQFTFSYNSDTTDSVNFQFTPGCGQSPVTVTSSSHGWGELSRMITPSGAQVDYSHSLDGKPDLTARLNNAESIPGNSVTRKTITHDGGAVDTWTYGSGKTTGSVTAPDGSSTIEYFFPHDPAKARSFAGSDGKGGLVYRSDRSGKILIERQWAFLIFDGANAASPEGLVGFNTVVDTEYTSLMEGGSPVKMSAKKFQYDFNGNVTQIIEYDWFDPSLVTRDGNGVPTAVPASATVLRTTTTSYHNSAPASSSPNVYAKRSIATATPLILSAPQQAITGPSQTQFSYDNQEYGAAPTNGNLTRVSKWDDQAGAWRDTTYGYDSFGNRITITDPRNNVTNVAFDSATHAQPTQVTVNPLNGSGAQTTTTVYDYWTGLITSVTDPNNQTTTTSYINQLLGAVDPFGRPGVVTGPPVNSVVDGVTYADQQRKVKTTYFDDARQMVVESDLNQTGDYKLKSRTSYDQLGRVIKTESNEDGAANYSLSKETVYVQMGLITLTSNPKRSSAAATDGWTRATRDTLGKVIEVATFSGATQPPDVGSSGNWTGSATTSYNANQTTITDQVGRRRRSETDALGRLVKVTEDPDGLGYETFYLYDALGNLRKVTQGSQTRWFAYDSLSRLIRVKNPEQNCNPNLPPHTDPFTGGNCWSTAYSYDANGNLTRRIDARGVVANYSYDALNRNTDIDYPNSSQTSAVRRFYDGAVGGKGRLHYEWTQEGGVNATQTAIDSYDALGRAFNQRQHFWRGSDWGTPYTTQQGYDLAGSVKTVTYPSGHIVNYSHDQAGRLSSFTGNLGDGVNRNYATGMQYDAAGLMKREQFGTAMPLYHRRHYNNRGQLFDIRLGTDPNPIYDSDDLNAWAGAAGSWNRGALRLYYSTFGGCHVYGNGGMDNNGNLLRMDHHIPLDDAVSSFVMPIDRYDYDALNRLKSVTELSYTQGPSGEDNYQGVFRQASLYDRWGNRTIDQANTTGGINSKTYIVDASTNRLQPGGSGTMQYDPAGNLQTDNYTSGVSQEFVYDSENRLVEAKNGAGVTVGRYIYDADGRRVRRIIGGQETWQVYGIGGELLAEYPLVSGTPTLKKEYGYRNGQLLVVWDGSEIGDRQLQWLVQDHLGSTRMVVDRSGSLGGIRRHDFLPFGEELSAGVGIRSAALGYGDDAIRQKFDGYERDPEIGLDFAQARYYANLQGRFTSPDVPLVDQSRFDPQSWNLYAFVRNNPCANTDPSGRETCYFSGQTVLACEGAKKGTYRIDYEKDLIYIKDKNGNEVSYQLDARFVVRGGASTTQDFIFEMSRRAPALQTVATGAGIYAGAMIALPTIGLAGGGSTTLGLSGTTTTTTVVVVASEQGAIIGWGTGQSAAAVQQTLQVTANLTREKVAEMVAQGLSKQWVQEQLVKYGASVLAGGAKLANKQLLPRKELMGKIMELWPK